jgi:hypothetical protein
VDWNEETIDKCVTLIEARLRALFEKTNRLTHPPAPVQSLDPRSAEIHSLAPFEWPHKKDLRALYDLDRKTHVSLATDADRVEAARRMVHYAQFDPSAVFSSFLGLKHVLARCDDYLREQETALIRFQEYDEARRQCLAKQFLKAADADANSTALGKWRQEALCALEKLLAG